jgi:competence protein ComK
MKNLDNYFINKETCAILPLEKGISKVIEFNNTFIVNKSANSIIDDSCKYFGSSYKGRCDGSKVILKMNYKLPIIIEEFNNIIFFPTNSPRFGNCTWISLKNIDSYLKGDNISKILFYNDVELLLDISYYSLENQIFRASLLDSLLCRRKNG